MLITGCRWQDLPREYGAPTTVWRRIKYWDDYRQRDTVERSFA